MRFLKTTKGYVSERFIVRIELRPFGVQAGKAKVTFDGDGHAFDAHADEADAERFLAGLNDDA